MKRSNLIFALTLPLFFMIMFPLCLVNALHLPTPHDVPVAVVGPGADAFIEQAGPELDGSVELLAGGTQEQAQQQLWAQDVRAVYEPATDEGSSELTVAGADGRMMSEVMPMIFEPIAEASGSELEVNDIAPLAAGDGNGIGLMFYMLLCVLLGFLTANIVGNAAFFLRMRHRLLISAGVALLAPAVLFALMGGWLHVLQGSPGQIIAAMALGSTASFTVGLLTHTAVVFLGKWAIFPSIALFIFLNIPSSNSAFPHEFVPPFFGWISQWHLGAALVGAVRSVLYLHGAGIGRHLIVMGIWLFIAVLAIAAALVHRRRKARIEASRTSQGDAEEEQRHEAEAGSVGAGPLQPDIQGLVQEQDGKPVPGSRVILVGPDGQETGRLHVDPDGNYRPRVPEDTAGHHPHSHEKQREDRTSGAEQETAVSSGGARIPSE